jgi:chromate reductase
MVGLVGQLKVLGICGSLRDGSYNRKLLKIAGDITTALGAEFTQYDLKKEQFPLYDQDVEDKGLPESVVKFKALIAASDTILFALPEYNHSVPGVLKNAIDWASRSGNTWNGKTAAIFGASAGPFGTVRSQLALRQSFLCLNIHVLPSPQVFVPTASTAFNDDGSLREKRTEESLKKLIELTLKEAQSRP